MEVSKILAEYDAMLAAGRRREAGEFLSEARNRPPKALQQNADFVVAGAMFRLCKRRADYRQ